MRAHNDPLSMDELRAVSIHEIEAAERALLEGCDYRLRSHHPYGAIKLLASDVVSFFTKEETFSNQHSYSFDDSMAGGGIYASPRSVMSTQEPHHHSLDGHFGLDSLCQRALSIAQSALVYSDVNFIYPPGQIAFAAVALALDSHAYSCDDESSCCNRLGTKMREYMCARYSRKSEEEVSEYEQEVSKIISTLEACSAIDLEMFSPFWQFHERRYMRTAEREAIKIRKAIFTASRLRALSWAAFYDGTSLPARSPSPPPFGYQHHHHVSHHYQQQHYTNHHYNCDLGQRKRRREEEENIWTPDYRHHNYHHYHHNKIARVTPINTPFI